MSENLTTLLAGAQLILQFAILLGVSGVCLWALIHCATTPARAFEMENKRNKTFWLLLTGLALALSLLALPPMQIIHLSVDLFVLVIPGVYLADVRPAVAIWRKRGQQKPPPNLW